MQNRPIGPDQVARVLDAASVRYVIVGCHAVNCYSGRPRATVDVDAIVEFPKKATKAIAAAFPSLTVQDTPVVTRFLDADHEAIDLMKPETSKLWRRLIKANVGVEIGNSTIRIPTVEGVLAAKLSAISSPARRLADKHIDGGDFIRIVEANERLDRSLLAELGDLVYVGGGAELLRLVDAAKAGRRLEF